MKSGSIVPLFFLLFSCKKDVGKNVTLESYPSRTQVLQSCSYSSNTVISYSNTISKIMQDNCLPCHAKPGSGGINLDSYQSTKDLALGEMMQVVTYNPGNIQMPPPPQKLLDSCQIKALNLWIKQGCLFN